MIPNGAGTAGGTSLRFSCISSLSARGGRAPCLQWLHRNDATHHEPPMITVFFTFATVGFFVAIAAHVVESVASSRRFG